VEDDDERWMPTMCRIVLTMPLNIEIDNTVFTRRTHNTPSDGAGRLERPILINAESFRITKVTDKNLCCKL